MTSGPTSGPTPQQLEALSPLFELRGELGRGGGGTVLRAWDRAARREVALKVIVREEQPSTHAVRFQREGEVTASLDHPHIVRVHSAGSAGLLSYLAYELVEGETLESRLFEVPRHKNRI